MFRKFTILAGVFMLLGSVLLWQKSMMVHYAFRQSSLAQEKAKLLNEGHRLEVEIRHHSRPEVLYEYWQRNEKDFDFYINPKERKPSEEKDRAIAHFAGLKP